MLHTYSTENSEEPICWFLSGFSIFFEPLVQFSTLNLATEMEMSATDLPARSVQRLEEAVWVTQARMGDTAAFVSLMKRYERSLLYFLRRMVPVGDGALDLHQEVWIDVFRGLSSLQVPEAFSVWLYRIAHHKAARFIGEEMRREELAAVNGTELPSVADEFDAEAVHRGLGMLPAPQREVLTLHYLNDLSTAEIASVLDCPPGTVKSRLHHARLALREVIERKNL